MKTVLAIFELIKLIGPWALIVSLLILIFQLLLNENLTDKYRGKIYKWIYFLSGKTEHEKKYISNDVKSSLNIARNKMHFGKEVLPRAVDIAWVQEKEGSSIDIKEGEFVVRLDPSIEQRQNIAILATAVVKRTTLVGIRHILDANLQQAIDLNLTRNILKETNNKFALDWFLENMLKKKRDEGGEFQRRNGQITLMDERGLFTRVFLVELEIFSQEIFGRTPMPYMIGEIEGLISYLENICRRKPGQEVPLQYLRAHISIGIIIVAKTDKILQSIEPYVKAIKINIERRINTIYILVHDKDWLGEVDPKSHKMWEDQLEKLDKEIAKKTVVEKAYDVKFSFIDGEGQVRHARCIKYRLPS